MREELARTHARVGFILRQVGSAAEAVAASERAVALYADLSAARPDQQDLRAEDANCRQQLSAALALADRGRAEEVLRLAARLLRNERPARQPGPSRKKFLAALFLALAAETA